MTSDPSLWRYRRRGRPEFTGSSISFSKKCHLYRNGTKGSEYDDVDVPSGVPGALSRSTPRIGSRASPPPTTRCRALSFGRGDRARGSDRRAEGFLSRGAVPLFWLFFGAAELT